MAGQMRRLQGPKVPQCWALALALLSCAAVFPLGARAGTLLPCPPFTCTLGSYFYGKFVDRNDPSDEAEDPSSVLAYAYFEQSDFYQYGLLDGVLDNGELACAIWCEYWNMDNDNAAGYWMFEQTCDWAVGGQCMCMAKDMCSANLYSDEWMEDYEYGQFFKYPANYTVGKVCDSNVVGDPHFTGADGSHFEFSGAPNKTFAIISDAHVQVNAYLGGRYGRWGERIKALTWIRQVSIMWGHHVAVLTARASDDPSYKDGYLESVIVDGEPLVVQPYSKAFAADGEFTVAWTGVKSRSGSDLTDTFKVTIGDTLRLRLVLRPEVRNLRTSTDAVIHFSLSVEQAQLSSNAHGVLGQTYRPDFAGRLAGRKLEYSSLLRVEVVPGDNAEGFIDGSVQDYMVRDLFKADCKYCRFARAASVDEETARAIAMAAAVTTDSFSSRKLLSQSQG